MIVLVLSVGRYAWGVYGEDVWARQVAPHAEAAKLLAGKALEATVPGEQDAAADLVAAVKQLDADWRGNWILDNCDSAKPWNDEELALASVLVRHMDRVWPKLDAAERKSGANWHVEGDYDRSLSQVGRVTPFLQVAAQYYHRAGDERRALACIRRVLHLASLARRAPDGYMETTATFQTAARTVLQVAPDLRVGTDGRAVSEADVRALIAAMLDESDAGPSIVRHLEYRRAVVIDDSAGCLEERFPRICMLPTILRGPWKLWFLRPAIQTDTAIMLHQADQVLAAARVADDLPTLLSLAPEAGRLHVLRDESPYLHVWAVTCWPRYDLDARQHFEAVTERRMAATALALRAYSLAHAGELPARLDALVPEWLPAIPDDPMAHGRPLTYRPEGADPLLYSVGRNGIDDGGSEEAPPTDWTRDDSKWSHLWWNGDAIVHLRGVPVHAPTQ